MWARIAYRSNTPDTGNCGRVGGNTKDARVKVIWLRLGGGIYTIESRGLPVLTTTRLLGLSDANTTATFWWQKEPTVAEAFPVSEVRSNDGDQTSCWSDLSMNGTDGRSGNVLSPVFLFYFLLIFYLFILFLWADLHGR
jgi:hypothetical protein